MYMSFISILLHAACRCPLGQQRFSNPPLMTESCPQPLWVILGQSFLLFFIRNRSGDRLKYCCKRVIFHEASDSRTCLFNGLLAINHSTTPPAYPNTPPGPSLAAFCSPSSFPCLFPSSLVASSSLSLSTSKLSIILAADDLDRFGLGV